MIGEVYAFLASVLCGVFALTLYKIAEAARSSFRPNTFFNIVLDVIWWCAVALVFCICMWQIVSLRIRGYEFLGVVLGAYFWNLTLGRYIEKLFKLIFDIFLKIIQFILKILLTPWSFLYKILVVRK